MPTRHVVLTEHHERVIADLVASGRYQNASEVLREGLRMIEARTAREAARIGFQDIDEGRFTELNADDAVDAFREARERKAPQRVSQARD